MGKYNFDYEKINALKRENEELRRQNAEICKRLGEVERLLSDNRQAAKRTIAGALDREKYMYLFGLEINKDGEIRETASGTAASDLFTPFQANIMRTICPRAYMPPKSAAGKYRLMGRRLEDLTDEEFSAVAETFRSVVDILAYAKKKISGGDKNVQ